MDNRSGMAVLYSIRQAYRDWCKPLCQEMGMPQVAFDILMFLSTNPELCTARDINRHQGVKKNVLSVNIARLVDEGYLERLSVEGDRRKVQLVLTEKARPVIARGKRAQETFDLRIREGITPEDLATFVRCLSVAGENARKIRAATSHQELRDEEYM